MLLATVDDRGRVLLPPKVREWLGVASGDRVWFTLLGVDVLESRREIRFSKLEVPRDAQG